MNLKKSSLKMAFTRNPTKSDKNEDLYLKNKDYKTMCATEKEIKASSHNTVAEHYDKVQDEAIAWSYETSQIVSVEDDSTEAVVETQELKMKQNNMQEKATEAYASSEPCLFGIPVSQSTLTVIPKNKLLMKLQTETRAMNKTPKSISRAGSERLKKKEPSTLK